jgi:cytosine/adenosine deaminase-related metal-dependent hydrolase
VHPGFIDTHMHVSHQLIRGAFSDTTAWDELVNLFFLDYWNSVGDEEEYAGSLLGCLEMIRNGTTCFLEAGSVFEPDTTAQAATDVGIRAVLSDPWVWDTGPLAVGDGRLPRTPATTDEAVSRLGRQLKRNQDPESLVRGHVAIYGLGTATDALYLAAKDIAERADVTFNTHQSFHTLDVQADRSRLGRPAICHYDDLGVLNGRTTLAHANFADQDEIQRLVQSRVSVAWCPAVSMIWASGGAVRGCHAQLHRAGCNVALGTDSSIVSNPLDLSQAGLLAILSARDASEQRDALIAEDALEMATINGARAVGLERELGSLEVGKRADIVIRKPDDMRTEARGDFVAQLVYAGSARDVHTVIVNGQVVLENGVFPGLDEAELRVAGEASAERIFKKMGWEPTPRWPVVRG